MTDELTRRVARLLPSLEFRMFQEPDERERWAEIRTLAQQQVADDSNTTGGHHRDRIGRTWVEHVDPDQGEPLWPRLTPEQQQLEVNMMPLLRELTDKQQDALRLLFYGQLTERQAALALGIHQKTLQERRDAGLKKLRNLIEDKYLAPAPDVAD